MARVSVTRKDRDHPVIHVDYQQDHKGVRLWIVSSQYYTPSRFEAHRDVLAAIARRSDKNDGEECGRAICCVTGSSKGRGRRVSAALITHVHRDKRLLCETLALDPDVPPNARTASLTVLVRTAADVQAALRDDRAFELHISRGQRKALMPLLGALGLKEVSEHLRGLGGYTLRYAPGQRAEVASRARR